MHNKLASMEFIFRRETSSNYVIPVHCFGKNKRPIKQLCFLGCIVQQTLFYIFRRKFNNCFNLKKLWNSNNVFNSVMLLAWFLVLLDTHVCLLRVNLIFILYNPCMTIFQMLLWGKIYVGTWLALNQTTVLGKK